MDLDEKVLMGQINYLRIYGGQKNEELIANIVQIINTEYEKSLKGNSE